jgi:hypothetical protein
MIEARVRLADEGGELEPVRDLLSELGIGWRDDPTSESEGGIDLLISTPRHALGRDPGRGEQHARTHIVVVDQVSRTLRRQLERHPCDFVVEAPLHPAALRLLIEHALYRGPERRSSLRALMACEVKIKAGLFSKKATLMQLSERGAGLMVEQPITSEELTLKLPPSWSATGKLEFKASVVDQHLFPEGGHLVSVVFRGISLGMRRELRAIMKAQAGGDGLLKPGSEDTAGIVRPASIDESSLEAEVARGSAAGAKAAHRSGATAQSRAAAPSKPGAERRSSARKPFQKRVLATLRGQAQAVISRDISAGGMRLEPDTGLSVGDELKLALYGAKGTPPIVLRAKVMNDEGARGMGLRFIDVGEKMQARLAQLVGESTVLGRAGADGEERPKMVLTEILDRSSEG